MVGNNLWNSIRVKNFVKGLGKRPTKWDENIAFLAECAGITVTEFLQTDPISIGVSLWGYDHIYSKSPNPIIAKIMTPGIYRECWAYYTNAVEYNKHPNGGFFPIADLITTTEYIFPHVFDLPPPLQTPQPSTKVTHSEWRCSECSALWHTVA